MEHHGDPAASHGRGLCPAKQGLELGGQYRATGTVIIKTDPLSGRNGQCGRGEGLQLRLFRLFQKTIEGR